MKRASIDIGSNTILLLIAEFNGHHWIELANESEVTALGKELDINKAFHPESMKASEEAFKRYYEIVKEKGIDPGQVIVTATEASRVAQNSKEFFKDIKNKFGFLVTIINAQGEAYYTAKGVCDFSVLPDNVTIMDIGGASTELMNVETKKMHVSKTISLPMGSVRCTEWLEHNDFDRKFELTIGQFETEPFKTNHLICVAGSMTSLGSMIKGLKSFDASAIDKSQIKMETFKKFISKLEKANADQISQEYPFLGKRAKTIKAGALLGLKVGEMLEVETFEISTRGLRYGTLFSGGIADEFKQL